MNLKLLINIADSTDKNLKEIKGFESIIAHSGFSVIILSDIIYNKKNIFEYISSY